MAIIKFMQRKSPKISKHQQLYTWPPAYCTSHMSIPALIFLRHQALLHHPIPIFIDWRTGESVTWWNCLWGGKEHNGRCLEKYADNYLHHIHPKLAQLDPAKLIQSLQEMRHIHLFIWYLLNEDLFLLSTRQWFRIFFICRVYDGGSQDELATLETCTKLYVLEQELKLTDMSRIEHQWDSNALW